MQRLVAGIHHFQQHVFNSQKKFFERLVDGQRPSALFITCSDSRINPNLITQTEPGELFILRNAGNIIPPYGAVHGGEAGTIEYAIAVLGVKDVVVCGHSHCGAIAGLLRPETIENLSAVKQWLMHAEATQRIIRENYSHLTDERARITTAVEENVLVQLENLRTHPSVAAALSRRAVTLHGWVYKFETGQVFTYHPDEGQFVELDSSPLNQYPVDEALPAI